jgi:hypothetical protein
LLDPKAAPCSSTAKAKGSPIGRRAAPLLPCAANWAGYRQGQEELNAKILSLAVYLGHRNIRHTYWYLTAVPELLALGSARWAKALASQKGAAHD